MSTNLISWIRFLVLSHDEVLIKRGLQEVCALLEIGYTWPAERRAELKRRLSILLESPNLLLRRWAYKVVGLLGDRFFLPTLRGKVERWEPDPENMLWAMAAATRLAPRGDVSLTGRPAVNQAAVLLARGFFFPGARPRSKREYIALVAEDDALALRWLSLLFGAVKGSSAASAIKSAIQDMNLHPDPVVAEYSIWALNEAGYTDFSDLKIYPQDLYVHPSNVRRWFFRLLLKDIDAINANFALVEHAINTDDNDVRDGIAIGLRPHQLGDSASELIVDWYRQETVPLVRAQLTRHLLTNADNAAYASALEHERAAPRDEMTAILLPGVRPKGIVGIIEIGEAQRRVRMKVPEIVSRVRRDTHVIAIDTVGFSKKEDSVQLAIFDDLLRAVAQATLPSGVDDQVVLLTGDGLIVAFHGQATQVLHFAIDLVRLWNETRKNEIRVGLHSGQAYWLTMSNSTRQLIGHAINWSVRVMAALPMPGLSIDASYYENIVKPSASEFRGITFTSVEGRATKHGEPIRAVDLSFT